MAKDHLLVFTVDDDDRFPQYMAYDKETDTVSPLGSKGLKPAKGACPNPFLMGAKVKTPLVSKEKKEQHDIGIRKVYEYDVNTKKGETLTFEPLN